MSESANDGTKVDSPDSAMSMPNKRLQAGERDFGRAKHHTRSKKSCNQSIYAFKAYSLKIKDGKILTD